jgi:hypothetical protein
MNFKLTLLLLFTIGSVGLFAGARPALLKPQQDPASVTDIAPTQDSARVQKPASNHDLIQRLEQLESRVAILENILFSTVKLEKTRAERLLSDRRNRYKNSRALYAQGMITEAEMQQDRLRLAEAEKEFELANAESRQKELASELELVEAERRLQAATDELTYCRNMARRGFATQSEVERLEKVVDEAKLSLENAKLKLKSAKELEALDK